MRSLGHDVAVEDHQEDYQEEEDDWSDVSI